MFEQEILKAFFITQISELVIILLVQKPKNIIKWIIAIIAINALTHPIAIFLLHWLNYSFLYVELGVLITEMVCYKTIFSLSWKRSFIISLLANIFSITVGYLFRYLL
jgi:hypothetical protein